MSELESIESEEGDFTQKCFSRIELGIKGEKMKDIAKEKEREIICFTSTFRSVITLTEKQVRANYIAPWWKRKEIKSIKTTEMSLQQPERFPHVFFLQGRKYHKIRTK